MSGGRHWLAGLLLSAWASSALAACSGSDCTLCQTWKAEALRRQIHVANPSGGPAQSTPFISDDIPETKHKPFIRVEGTNAIVLVGLGAVTGTAGDLIHPTVASDDPSLVHWIDLIWVEDQNGEIIAMRRPTVEEGSPATMVFPIPEGTVSMTAFEHCNSHGVFQGETIIISPVQTVTGLARTCNLGTCSSAGVDAICSSTTADYFRQQNAERSETDAYDGNANLKHKPSLTVNGDGTATIVVGQENVQNDGSITYHPQTASDDPGVLHWINAVWAVDQDGNIVAMHEVSPTDPSPVTWTFDIADGTTSLTSYEYCNIHGLFRGDTVAVAPSATTAVSELCGIDRCPLLPADTYARTEDCKSIVAEQYRKQESLNARSPLAFPTPYALGSDNEKHNPYVMLDGYEARVVVGKGVYTGSADDPIHPMTPDPADYGDHLHFIEIIWVEDQNGDVIAMRQLSANEPSPANMTFDIPEGTTSVRAYEFCNTHGLFQGPTTAVTAANIRPGARSGCSVQQCVEGTDVTTCQVYAVEFFRRDGSRGTAKSDPLQKHTPFLSISGTTATITVGIGAHDPIGHPDGLIHPMAPSDDPNLVHWIQYIFARDEMGNIVYFCELLPTHPSPATCSFEVPAGIVSLQPFEFCNKHGLYGGERVLIQQAQMNPNAERFCFKRECSMSQPSVSGSALVSQDILDQLQSQADSVNRIEAINMCNQNLVTFAIPTSQITAELQTQVDALCSTGTSRSEIEARFGGFQLLFQSLKLLGGSWHGTPEALEHTGVSTDTLRSDLIYEDSTVFRQGMLAAGVQEFVAGLPTPIESTEELLLIRATFEMDWGYQQKAVLNPHYSIFYSPNFTRQEVEVMLCAKTQGWMGIGWLDPYHLGHYMNHTDMQVAWVDENGEAALSDRFAIGIEEPLKDESLPNQRTQDGASVNGQNDLVPNPGTLGQAAKEWCGDPDCDPGFSLVQFKRPFVTPDASDARLPVRGTKMGLIHSFAVVDPSPLGEMVQHVASTTGYVELQWNLECLSGHYFDVERIECIPCDQGTFLPAQEPGSVGIKCLQCPAGTYQNETGQSTCKQCKSSFTTLGAGMKEEMACTCPGPSLANPDGWYHSATCPSENETTLPDGSLAPCAYMGECKQCPEGMSCPGFLDLRRPLTAEVRQRFDEFCSSFAYGQDLCSSASYCNGNLDDPACTHSPPILKVGYYSFAHDPVHVFLCKEQKACPGGRPGTCASRRDTTQVGCAKCIDDSFEDNGECLSCDGASVLPFLAMCIIAAFGLVFLAISINKDMAMRPGSMTTVAILAGVLFTTLQTLSTFASIEINWVEPVTSIIEVMSVLSFDLRIVRIGCILQQEPTNQFAVRLMCLPTAAAFVASCLATKKLFISPDSRFMVELVNTVGSVFQLMFIPIVTSFLAPFICYSHPGGGESMITAPSILCFEDPDHDIMVALGILALLLLAVPFVCMIALGTVMYPRYVSNHEVDGLRMFRFLFIRFHSKTYYFGGVMILRNMLICLVPVLVRKDPALQVLLLVLILMSFLLVQVWCKPWRPDPSKLKLMDANIIDACLTGGCILLLFCGALFTDYKTSQAKVQFVAMGIFVVFVVIVCSCLAVAARERFSPRPYYRWFITHHKGAAAAQARLIKMLLMAKTGKTTFIDSDDLTDLDTLFNTVKTKVDVLVVFATSQTLRRPWCTGEIVTAHKTKTQMILVRTQSFQDLTPQHYDDIENYLDPSHTFLAEYDISMDNVVEAYRELLTGGKVPVIEMSSCHGIPKFNFLCTDIINNGKQTSIDMTKKSTNNRSIQNKAGGIVISTDWNDDEATAAAAILIQKAQSSLFASAGSSEGDDEHLIALVDVDQTDTEILCKLAANARAFFALLSRNSLTSSLQLMTIVAAMEVSELNQTGMLVLPVSLPGFEFPSGTYYDEILPDVWPQHSAEVVNAIRSLFRKISVQFNTHGSDDTISYTVAELMRRVPKPQSGPKRRNSLRENTALVKDLAIIQRAKTSDRVSTHGLDDEITMQPYAGSEDPWLSRVLREAI